MKEIKDPGEEWDQRPLTLRRKVESCPVHRSWPGRATEAASRSKLRESWAALPSRHAHSLTSLTSTVGLSETVISPVNSKPQRKMPFSPTVWQVRGSWGSCFRETLLLKTDPRQGLAMLSRRLENAWAQAGLRTQPQMYLEHLTILSFLYCWQSVLPFCV